MARNIARAGTAKIAVIKHAGVVRGLKLAREVFMLREAPDITASTQQAHSKHTASTQQAHSKQVFFLNEIVFGIRYKTLATVFDKVRLEH